MDQFKIGIYSVVSSNDKNDWHLKYSSKSDEKFLKFIVFGDWGRKGAFNQSHVAEQMGYYCQNFGCDFAISTGDNFYQEGVKSVDDPLFKESFENVYKHESLQKIPFLSVLGNHVGNFDFRVQFLFFDTNPFIHKYYTHPKMNKEALHKTRDIRAQKKYMETNVNEFATDDKKSDIPLWKIAIGHHPFYSASTHGDNENLIEHLLPFLRKNDIRYYFSGHDHSIQYLKPYDTLNHFISGAGSAVRFDVSNHHPYLKKFQQESGFIYIRLSSNIMELSFVNLFGRVTERIKIPRE
ncbi:predicted protein [Naegleria gruberi]|uniref:Predicted protein n=1 Tax=Naegleria gruberi TaxID=5762 RepID=D2VI72_NAEGR|nr:uncharacterized protein NAEGRDRAFT_34284 [Naegleria gruberi]EFC43546.1 predicted protein [Naegleria gruberi]|eukprot:XP_002676290.1 predicted protein [Naegleria gruberi strain NEG-M]